MTSDPVEVLLAEALRAIVGYVEARDESATEDDDVRALEGVAHVLHQVASQDRDRLMTLLGPRLSFEVGLSDQLPED
ncbi:hypothetical protein [Nocardioides nitrophenolicus]|uniref:hypothetical protein n=1 Tax=Nocardioides nitrophenolicus TaxID=60489 RepID=UPI00195B8C36|nr:hypothetical protein [Nocardioides nitrophenolicus]MBM7516175.1 hypothetical protein [Nocardioides nitrophenolicus]